MSNNQLNEKIVNLIRKVYTSQSFVPLHAPCFVGNEKKYLNDCVDSTFVSSVGEYVNKFEKAVADYTGAKYAVATMNGTAALHLALVLSNVQAGDEVITQGMTFVATANAISYCGAHPVFIDSDPTRLGMSVDALRLFLENSVTLNTDNKAINKKTGRCIKACVPMHAFGHCVDILPIAELCKKYGILLVEDAAESLGSFYQDKHSGIIGDLGIISFNGNKIVTTGGGGMIITNNHELAAKAKHLSTTAKEPHAWEFYHDQVGYNYRMPNINAALGVAQMEKLDFYLENKRETARLYEKLFSQVNEVVFVSEPAGSRSNYWLNCILFKNKSDQESFLKYSNEKQIQSRPVWRLMDELPAFKNCLNDGLATARNLQDRLVNIPSSVRFS